MKLKILSLLLLISAGLYTKAQEPKPPQRIYRNTVNGSLDQLNGISPTTVPGTVINTTPFNGPTAPSGVSFMPGRSHNSAIVEFPVSGNALMKVYDSDMKEILTVMRDGSVSSEDHKVLDKAALYFWQSFANSFKLTLRKECRQR